ncbi:MAG TPA: helix-turn-helix transcriptional regulator [Aliidongia sp.]|uniref:helix-turn-helix transcriptional regulator n=1 Tax=Aliidongia sp. TaxID=1914230 RepID=UPI002DDD9761|nr:helix-turn-helix transcriptional regulator [Aliidongia sp.]HEV2674795.1 helix-turn-helix transcriptional regulator [Aliidongia sp.]
MATSVSATSYVPPDRVPDEEFLKRLGDRVREARAKRGMTRKILSRDSGVSERYLAQLETGQGNISILLLRQLAAALDMPIETLVHEHPDPSVDLAHALELLRRLDAGDLVEARQMLLQRFDTAAEKARRGHVALIGLRGAGKSTLGARLAQHLKVPFIELDREIERTAGVALSVIFDLYGQAGFRRLERQCLQDLIARHPRFVLATGGSLVSEPATFEMLLTNCFTVWLTASPAEHMGRVVAQGDMRPMASNREAMSDLQRILKVRNPLYSKADARVDTANRTIEESFELLIQATS